MILFETFGGPAAPTGSIHDQTALLKQGRSFQALEFDQPRSYTLSEG